MASDDPAFLAVGTAVSAKYKGAFCESTIKKIDKNVKCKITYKLDNKTSIVSDEDINGPLKVGAIVEVKKGDSKLEAIINRITDCSIYHVLFDDGDENSLKRSKLCLKGNKHFITSTTLDGLPLTHPEHFCSPVIKSNLKKMSSTPNQSDSEAESDSEANVRSDQEIETGDFFADRRQDLVGQVVYSTNPEGPRKNHGTNNHGVIAAPLLVVLPGAEGNTPSSSKVLTKSFKDSRFMSQSINSLKCVSLDDLKKFKDKSLKLALDRANLYLTKWELPSSWDRAELLGFSSDEESNDDNNDDGDDDDDDDYDKKRSSEMSDRFVAELYRFMEERGSPINCVPTISNMELDLYKLFHIVQRMGGYNKVTNQIKWHIVHKKMNFDHSITRSSEIKAAYKKYLHAFEDLDRKLGRFRSSSWSSKVTVGNRSIMSFRDREPELSASAKNIQKIKKRKEESEKIETDSIKETKEKFQITSSFTKLTKTIKADLSDVDLYEDQNIKDQHQQSKLTEIPEPKRKSKPDEQDSIKSMNKDPLKKIKDSTEGKKIKKLKEKHCSDQMKVRKTPIEPKLIKDNMPLKLVSKDGRSKEKKSEENRDYTKSKILKSLKVKDAAASSISSKDGKDDEDDEMRRKRRIETQIQAADINLNKNERISRRILRRGNTTINSHENKEENLSIIPSPDIIYPIGTRLKVRYGDGKNTKIYGAKILESKQRNDCQMYLVHYNGWNSRYDDWIYPNQIVDVLEESSEDQVSLLPPRSGRNRLNRYQRLSSSDTLSGKGDGDKIKNKKHLDSSESNSDSDSNMGSDLNSEKSMSMKGKRETPIASYKFLPDEKGDNVTNLKHNSDMSKMEDKEKIVETKFEESLFLLVDAVSDSNGSGHGDGKSKREERNIFETSIINSSSNEKIEKDSPTFQRKIFPSSAFTRKENKELVHKTQISENRSVWKEDGRLNLNLTESPIKTSSPTSPFFEAFQKNVEEFKFEIPVGEEEDRKGEEEYLWCTVQDNEGSDGDKNSPIETTSSEGGVGEENASTKSDREANREVEAYMTVDYTILDRKADYVMLKHLPGDKASFYVPSLDDSSDASSTGRIACPKPILPYGTSTMRKEEMGRKRKKDDISLNDVSDSEINSQKVKGSKNNTNSSKKHQFDGNILKHERNTKKRSYNLTTRSLSKNNNLNFVDLDALKDLEGEDRIEFIMGRIQDLRTVYLELKADVACIDRRRRKHRDKNKDASIFMASEIVKT